MTDPLDHSTRYDLMKSDQVPADEIAAWLKEPGFAAYVERRQGKPTSILKAAKEMRDIASGKEPAARIWIKGHAYVPEATTPKPAPSADAVIDLAIEKAKTAGFLSIEDLEALRATIPAAEPCAWLIACEVWTRDKAKADDARARGMIVEPLFAAPRPALGMVPTEWHAEAEALARHWHREIEAIGAMLGLGAVDAGEVPAAVQALITRAEKAETQRAEAEAEIARYREELGNIANSWTAHGYDNAKNAVEIMKDIAKEALNAQR